MSKFISLSLQFIFIFLFGCCPHHYIPPDEPEPLPPLCMPKRIRTALVLGGGGVRGMAHVGVLEELEEAGIPIDLIVGCSAGAIVGALYADNPNAQAVKHAIWRLKTNSFFDIDIFNCRYGLCQARSMCKILNEYLWADNFEELRIPLVVTACDLNSGELVPIGCGNLQKAIQASCAVPFVFVPCEHLGRILVDGGVINSVPVRIARDLGAEVIIAVDLCELLPKTFPTNLFGIAARSAEISFIWQNEICTRNADIIIKPNTCGLGMFDEKMKAQAYEAGRCAAKAKIESIKDAVFTHFPGDFSSSRLVYLGCYSPADAK